MSADEWDKVSCIVCFILGFIYLKDWFLIRRGLSVLEPVVADNKSNPLFTFFLSKTNNTEKRRIYIAPNRKIENNISPAPTETETASFVFNR